jgi:hypothetical protein
VDATPERCHAVNQVRVKIGSQCRMFLYSNAHTMEYFKSKFLREVVPSFDGAPTLFAVSYTDKAVTIYHQYTGGPNWIPSAPEKVAKPGEVLIVIIHVLTAEVFVESLPRVALANYMGADWMTDVTSVNTFAVEASRLAIGITQDPEVEGVSSYKISGIASAPLGFNKGITSCNLAFWISLVIHGI